MLGRGELRCIGATTLDEYRKYIEKDPALERRFQQVYVDQPSVTSTIAILRGLRERYFPITVDCHVCAVHSSMTCAWALGCLTSDSRLQTQTKSLMIVDCLIA